MPQNTSVQQVGLQPGILREGSDGLGRHTVEASQVLEGGREGGSEGGREGGSE